MLIKGTLILKDKRPFCLFKDREVGLASGYFAGDMFASTHGDEYITECSGESFGWFDADGQYFRDRKYDMTRPTLEQIVDAILSNYDLKERALARGLIEVSEVEINGEDEENYKGIHLNVDINDIFLN